MTAALSPSGLVIAQRLRATEVGVEEQLRERVGASAFDRAIGLLRALVV